MSVGSFQLTQPISHGNARLSEVTLMTMGLESSPATLLGGTAGAVYIDDEAGLRSGIAIGGKIDLAINFGSELSGATRSAAPTPRSGANQLLLARWVLPLLMIRRSFSKKHQSLPLHDRRGDERYPRIW